MQMDERNGRIVVLSRSSIVNGCNLYAYTENYAKENKPLQQIFSTGLLLYSCELSRQRYEWLLAEWRLRLTGCRQHIMFTPPHHIILAASKIREEQHALWKRREFTKAKCNNRRSEKNAKFGLLLYHHRTRLYSILLSATARDNQHFGNRQFILLEFPKYKLWSDYSPFTLPMGRGHRVMNHTIKCSVIDALVINQIPCSISSRNIKISNIFQAFPT